MLSLPTSKDAKGLLCCFPAVSVASAGPEGAMDGELKVGRNLFGPILAIAFPSS